MNEVYRTTVTSSSLVSKSEGEATYANVLPAACSIVDANIIPC